MLSKKQYKKLAKCMARCTHLWELEEEIMDFLREDSPSFDEMRFNLERNKERKREFGI